MNYSKVSFDIIRLEIEKIFSCENYQKEWNLRIDKIIHLADSNGIELKWNEIPNWDNVDYDYSDQEFLEIAYIEDFNSESIYIITDECFKDQMGFSVKPSDLIAFIEKVYNEEFQMDFPQPSDFIFVQPSTNLLTMIHHEGVRTKYIKSLP